MKLILRRCLFFYNNDILNLFASFFLLPWDEWDLKQMSYQPGTGACNSVANNLHYDSKTLMLRSAVLKELNSHHLPNRQYFKEKSRVFLSGEETVTLCFQVGEKPFLM